ncbi:universal stress protein [Thioalkalivibrio paradoxus]|uniref:Universal stress protein UspA n=1 Tax=Thioalkalivibrio paradoxus ARh 1 TaxID=713585 RepID=W0DM02_9GAMM|nr:universal stress protein [Thioalkalivibrio paradoxus]AHE98023.1 universal stress protein UspA [Thioalkalivibrio paradoxus ARh 1]
MAGIFVGVDGSDGARRALRWAREEGVIRGTRVHAVFVLDRRYLEPEWASLMAPPVEQLREEARRLLQQAVEQAGGAAAELSENVLVGEGHGIAKALLDAASDADLLVVGSRGRGGFHGLRLGSVSQQILHHARCPVVVVPAG